MPGDKNHTVCETVKRNASHWTLPTLTRLTDLKKHTYRYTDTLTHRHTLTHTYTCHRRMYSHTSWLPGTQCTGSCSVCHHSVTPPTLSYFQNTKSISGPAHDAILELCNLMWPLILTGLYAFAAKLTRVTAIFASRGNTPTPPTENTPAWNQFRHNKSDLANDTNDTKSLCQCCDHSWGERKNPHSGAQLFLSTSFLNSVHLRDLWWKKLSNFQF